MTPFCLPKIKRYWPEIRRNSGKLAFLALLGMVLNQSLGYYAAATTTASNMALLPRSCRYLLSLSQYHYWASVFQD